MAYYDINASGGYDTGQHQQQQQPQPGGLFSMQLPGMSGVARTMASMHMTTIADQQSVDSMEMRRMSAVNPDYDDLTTSENRPQHQQQQQQQQPQEPGKPDRAGDGDGEIEADYDDDSDDSEDLTRGLPPAPAKRSYDTETMTTRSDSSPAGNIQFRVDYGDGERSLSDESENQEANYVEEDDLCVCHVYTAINCACKRCGCRSVLQTRFSDRELANESVKRFGSRHLFCFIAFSPIFCGFVSRRKRIQR
jgi:hypothetical protein